ncbi:PAS domain S-box protein [Methylobacterium sp. CM6241]
MQDEKQRPKRQRVLADFGEFALRSQNIDELLIEACRLIAEALDTDRAKILEIEEDEQCLLVRAGVGWDSGIVGHLRLPMSERSSETFAIKVGKPVITQDIAKEERFALPAFLQEAGVQALVNVPIFVPGGKAYGLLQVDANEPRDFQQDDIEFLRTYATILGPVIDRLHKVISLSASEERFRLVAENARDYAIFICDPEDRITDWYPGAENVFGWTAEEARGQLGSIIFTPADQAQEQPRIETETAHREGWAPNVRWHQRKDGAQVFIDGGVTALYHPDGSLRGFLKIGQDVTERGRIDEALRESEERFRTLASLVPVLLWCSDASGVHNSANQPWLDYTGQSLEQSQDGGWLDAVHPDDRTATYEVFSVGHAEQKLVEVQHRIRGQDGSYRWFLIRQTPITDEDGRLIQWFGAAMDIDELRNAQVRQEVLVKELQHRSRNLLGVVSSLANRTVGKGSPVASFTTRLQALGRAQALLSQSGADTVEVRALVNAELAAHADDAPSRITISGPKVLLTSQQVQNFALAMHELATNAVKYGALKDETGCLSVTWDLILGADSNKQLALNWIESGVDVQPEAATRRGYGRELIEQALAYALGGRTEFVLGTDGVRCRIELPVT